MQKINKKGSILLWSVMLSLIISILFISISTKINKNIKDSGEISDFIIEQNIINKNIHNNNNSEINYNKVIIFDNTKKKIFSLNKNEELQITFSGSNDFNIDLGIINGGTVEYNFFKVDAGDTKTLTNSGILYYEQSFSGSFDNKNSILEFKNLGGYSNFLINSEINFKTSDKKYKIIQTIGNNKLIQTKGTK